MIFFFLISRKFPSQFRWAHMEAIRITVILFSVRFFFTVGCVCLANRIDVDWKKPKMEKWANAALCVVCIVGMNFLINNKQITLFFRSAAVLCWCNFFSVLLPVLSSSLDKWILENIYIHTFYIRSVFVGWLCVCVFTEYFYGNSINISFLCIRIKKKYINRMSDDRRGGQQLRKIQKYTMTKFILYFHAETDFICCETYIFDQIIVFNFISWTEKQKEIGWNLYLLMSRKIQISTY